MKSLFGQKITQGMPAPQFEGFTPDGRKVSLADFQGKKVWLCFYRYASCPLCNLHVAELIRRAPLVREVGAEIVAVFESEPKSFPAELGGESKVPFPCIADPQKKLYAEYGLGQSLLGLLDPRVARDWIKANLRGFRQGKIDGELGQMPAQFLVREDGVVHTAFYGTHAVDHLPWWRVKRFLAEESVYQWQERLERAFARR